MKKNAWHTLKSYLCMQGSLVLGSGHLLVQVLKRKWYSAEENSPQGAWGHNCGRNAVGIRRKRMPDFPCYDTIV